MQPGAEGQGVAVSPFAIIPIGKIVRTGKPKGQRHLTRAEIGRMMEVLRGDIEQTTGWAQWKSRRLYMVVCLGLYCGLRSQELLRLQVADLDLAARLIRLAPHNKTGRFKNDNMPSPFPWRMH